MSARDWGRSQPRPPLAPTGGSRRREPPGLRARRAALAALRAVEDDGRFSTRAVPQAVAGLDDSRDRAFAASLAYETLRWRDTLDWALATVLDRPVSEVEPPLLRVLRLATVQLVKLDVPTHAAVATAVDLAREAVPPARAGGSARFTNGVLRALARTRDRLPWPPEDDVAAVAVTTAHREWIVAELAERLGLDRAAAVLHADNDAPGVTLRANGDRDELVAELRAAGIDATPGAHAAEAVRAPGADPRRLGAVAAGRATPQDEASMLVAHATGVGPGSRVLDLCAGPGGKATHLARLAGPGGAVTAVELQPGRAQLVTRAAARQGVAVDVRVGDALTPPLGDSERFDVVLVDAPCSGLGTGRRRPEVRWRRRREEVPGLAALQLALLRSGAVRVAPGGHLTYAVCTWTAAETTGVVEAFKRSPEAVDHTLEEQRQLFPDRDGTDGMFHATFRRAAAT